MVLIQPTARDLATMGSNYMSTKRRHEVIETAVETVSQQLRQADVMKHLKSLPPGADYKVTRPSTPASTWSELIGAGARRSA